MTNTAFDFNALRDGELIRAIVEKLVEKIDNIYRTHTYKRRTVDV